jgi:amidase
MQAELGLFRAAAGRAALLALLLAASVPAASEAPRDTSSRDCAQGLPVPVAALDLQRATVRDLQAAFASGTLSSAALLAHQLALICIYDGPETAARLNAVRSLRDGLRAEARRVDVDRQGGRLPPGPLAGVTVLLKDNIGLLGLPTTAGSIALADHLSDDAALVTRLRAAGAIVMGKTNLSEFANWVDPSMPNGYSSLGGQVRAPYDLAADASGSSTGSAVSAAMGYATVTIGTETSGSIISPATAHRLVGLKPTRGLVSRRGILPLAPSFDTAGPITRNLTDAAAVLQVIAGVDPQDPATRRLQDGPLQGRVPDYLAALTPGALQGARLGVRRLHLQQPSEAFAEALEAVRALGAELVPVEIAPLSAVSERLVDVVLPYEFRHALNAYLAETRPGTTLGGIVAFNRRHPARLPYGQRFLLASNALPGDLSEPRYQGARDGLIQEAQALLDAALDGQRLDALLAPDWGNTLETAAAGYPNLTVPMGHGVTAPEGLSFAGAPFSEARLIALAYDYEQASQKRRPPLEVNPALLAQSAQP